MSRGEFPVYPHSSAIFRSAGRVKVNSTPVRIKLQYIVKTERERLVGCESSEARKSSGGVRPETRAEDVENFIILSK